ncbi:MAG: ATP synthase F1 subunit delta [Lentisphaerae bacterium]|nr:ATP synthase F1 subunit delta [Lentisphaerota bacterium]
MSSPEVVRRYAKALVLAAGATGEEARVGADLGAIAECLEMTPPLGELLRNPAIPSEAKGRVLEDCFKVRVAPLTWNFLQLLAGKKREALLTAIAGEYARVMDEKEGRVRVGLAAAQPLNEPEREAMKRRLSEALKKNVQLETTVEPELLAGIVLRVGDRLIDGSARGRLDRIREELMQAADTTT